MYTDYIYDRYGKAQDGKTVNDKLIYDLGLVVLYLATSIISQTVEQMKAAPKIISMVNTIIISILLQYPSPIREFMPINNRDGNIRITAIM